MDYYTALVFYKTGHYDSYNCNDVTDALSFISSCNSVHYAFITSFPDCRYIPVFTCNSGIDISYCDFFTCYSGNLS